MLELVEIARFTPHVAAVTQFYQQLLGAAPKCQYPGMSEFQSGRVTLRIHETYPVGPGDLPPEDHIAFATANLDESCRHLEQAGFRLEVPPRTFDWGRSAYLRDPDGRLVELHEG